MRWFKHFSDNHRGQSIQGLLDECGHAGLVYYILVEMCAEKIERSDKELSCSFVFPIRIVRQNLRMNWLGLRKVFESCSKHGLLAFEMRGEVIEIQMPILLNLLDRDVKNARITRASHAQKSRLDKDKDKEREYNACSARFDAFFNSFKERVKSATGKVTRKGQKAQTRYDQQIKNEKACEELTLAISQYGKHLEEFKWKEPKQTFESFLGSERSGFYWRDFIEEPQPKQEELWFNPKTGEYGPLPKEIL